MQVTAQFPLSFVKEIIKVNNVRDYNNKFNRVAIMHKTQDLSYVYCGNKPLKASIWVYYINRYPVSLHCYVDVDNGLVFPG